MTAQQEVQAPISQESRPMMAESTPQQKQRQTPARKKSFFNKPQVLQNAKSSLKKTITETKTEIVSGQKVTETVTTIITEPGVPRGLKGKLMKKLTGGGKKTTEKVVTRQTTPLGDVSEASANADAKVPQVSQAAPTKSFFAQNVPEPEVAEVAESIATETAPVASIPVASLPKSVPPALREETVPVSIPAENPSTPIPRLRPAAIPLPQPSLPGSVPMTLPTAPTNGLHTPSDPLEPLEQLEEERRRQQQAALRAQHQAEALQKQQAEAERVHEQRLVEQARQEAERVRREQEAERIRLAQQQQAESERLAEEQARQEAERQEAEHVRQQQEACVRLAQQQQEEAARLAGEQARQQEAERQEAERIRQQQEACVHLAQQQVEAHRLAEEKMQQHEAEHIRQQQEAERQEAERIRKQQEADAKHLAELQAAAVKKETPVVMTCAPAPAVVAPYRQASPKAKSVESKKKAPVPPVPQPEPAPAPFTRKAAAAAAKKPRGMKRISTPAPVPNGGTRKSFFATQASTPPKVETPLDLVAEIPEAPVQATKEGPAPEPSSSAAEQESIQVKEAAPKTTVQIDVPVVEAAQPKAPTPTRPSAPAQKKAPSFRKQTKPTAPEGVPSMFAHSFGKTPKRSKPKTQRVVKRVAAPAPESTTKSFFAPRSPMSVAEPIQETAPLQTAPTPAPKATPMPSPAPSSRTSDPATDLGNSNHACGNVDHTDLASDYEEITIYDDQMYEINYFEEETLDDSQHTRDSRQAFPLTLKPAPSGQVKLEGMDLLMANLKIKVPTVH